MLAGLRPYLILPGLAVNFILIESLQRFYQFYGDDVQVSPQLPPYACIRRVQCHLTSVRYVYRWNARQGAEIT